MTIARTSLTHPLWIDELPIDGVTGLMGLTLCPGKKIQYGGGTPPWERDLETDMAVIAEWGASAVVSLMESHEFVRFKVPDLGELVRNSGMTWFHMPITDVKPPDNRFEERWKQDGGAIREMLSAGERVLMHCRGGLGRTGTVAGRVLVEFGYAPEAAIRAVRRARDGAIETPAQARYVRSLSQLDV